MGNGKWEMVNGEWSTVNGQWQMVQGDLPVDILKYHLDGGSIDLVMGRKRRGSMGRMEKKGKYGERIWRKGEREAKRKRRQEKGEKTGKGREDKNKKKKKNK
ncbi:uncharacterized protein EAE98_004925 [Botrytis deweyae]|uniref:Uncharacterized protein n=1 Tax=Botrytis deweyae TaxID=2478750 RepID=A0ABQ7IPQ4_9HELO|nr:uncharacterized protein EAE98_004925 [Botrytis deweyae]KAF7930525.1 hypothetical protein EAE98_004925 [Botrytis deweyae]